MSFNPEQGFFSVVSGVGTNPFDNVLYNKNYLSGSGLTLQTKNNLSLDMSIEFQLATRQSSAAGAITMYKLSSTNDRNYFGQHTGYIGSALMYSDDRIVEVNNQSFNLQVQISTGSGNLTTIGEACCSLIFFY